jgi:cyanuric acid amidohydrolase
MMLVSTITCPRCGHRVTEQIPVDACQFFMTAEIAYKSMAYSRGASAIGVGVAMGEIAPPVADAAVLSDWSLASGVASASAGFELKNNIVIVLGNAEEAAGNCVIAHAVMEDAIDAAVVKALRRIGDFRPDSSVVDRSRIVNVLAKADPSPDGMLRDTDISATRHARAAVGGVIAGLTGLSGGVRLGRGRASGSAGRQPGRGHFAGVTAGARFHPSSAAA